MEGSHRQSELSELRADGITEISQIAKGGMSLVYRGVQTALGREVVIKKIRPELKGNPEILQRFRREARAMAGVLHQNVAHVYDFVEMGSDSYIVMEHILGIDLSTIVQRLGPIPPEVAASVALGMTRGLGFIHERNLIHRDVKPANVRLTPRGEVKLMDFGIVMDTDANALTRPGVMVGSPSYLSPEQILGENLTPTSDLFLVGICLYEMLTGNRPFEDKGDASVFRRIREADYLPVHKCRSGLPRELTSIVSRCLQRKPQNRYKSAVELGAALERFLGEYQSRYYERRVMQFLDREALVPVQFSEVPKPSQESAPRPGRYQAAALAVLASSVAFIAGYLLANTQAKPTQGEFPKPRPIETPR